MGRRWSVLTVSGVGKCRVVWAAALGMVAVCSDVHINALCGQNVELFNVKLAVHIVTTGTYRVKSLL